MTPAVIRTVKGERVYMGAEMQLWVWRNGEGQVTLSPSFGASAWLRKNCRDSPARQKLLQVYDAFHGALLRRRREAELRGNLKIKDMRS